MGEEKKEYEILVGKPERKRPLGRLRRRWDKVDVTVIGWKDVDWIRWLRIDTDGGILCTR
jgi:hypothetical protein